MFKPDQQEVYSINAEFAKLPLSVKEQVSSFSDNGYAIIKSFFSEAQVDEINGEVDRMLKSGEVSFQVSKQDNVCYP